MAPTVFRKGEELLKDAGSDTEYLAYLQISNKEPFGEVYLTNGPLHPYARKFFDLLSTEYTGKWISQTIHSNNKTISTSTMAPPEPLSRPRIKISPALAGPQKVEAESPTPVGAFSPGGMLADVIIVQGKIGPDCSKVVWKHSRSEIARAIFEEVINGYSTVFSGVMLAKDYQRLQARYAHQKVSITTVKGFPELLEFQQVHAPKNHEADLYIAWSKNTSAAQWDSPMSSDFSLGLFC